MVPSWQARCGVTGDRAEGWKEIAFALGVSVRTAQMRASRNFDPLPVRHGHKGPWAHLAALAAWVDRQDMAYTVHLEIQRTRIGA
jgi:hypothetical protein